MNTATAVVWAYVKLTKLDALSILCLVYLAERSARQGAKYATARELAAATGFSQGTINGRLSRLRDGGTLVRTWSGNRAYYRLNDNLLGSNR